MACSLKKLSQAQIVYNMVKHNKYLSMDDVHAIAKSLGCREATLERKLRPSIAPSWIERIFHKNAIVGYRFRKIIK